MITIINLEGAGSSAALKSLRGDRLYAGTERTGNRRIAERTAAERARVKSFNRHMTDAGMAHRTAMLKGIVR